MRRRVVLVLLTFVFSVGVHAGSAAPGSLSKLHFMSNDVVIVYTSGVRSNVPSCASSQPKRFALDGTTEEGKVQVSGLISAHAAGKNVTIKGKGSCEAYGDTETISYFYIAD
ncbi:MAG: hypothetical protein MK096_15085 [Oleiphilaceae bacterium]|nr:hypothetical protein [Oleiphilaceae bacterium]